MIGHKIAAQTKCFAQPIKKALHTAARLQCDGVQIDARQELLPAELSETGKRQLRKILTDLNLRVGSVVFPTRRGLASSADRERRVEAIQAALQLAADLHSRVLVVNLGSLPVAEDTPPRAALGEAVCRLAAAGNHYGVQLVLQAAGTAPELLGEWLGTFPEGSVAIDLHPAQLLAHDVSPCDYLTALGASIGHVYAVDGVYDVAHGQGVEVELGRGSVDLPEMLAGLEEHAYRGWLTIQRFASRQPVEDIGNAVQFLRAIGRD